MEKPHFEPGTEGEKIMKSRKILIVEDSIITASEVMSSALDSLCCQLTAADYTILRTVS